MKCLRHGCEYLQGLFPHIRSIEVKEGNHRNNQNKKRSLSFTQVWSKANGSAVFISFILLSKKIYIPRKCPYGTGSTIVVRALSPSEQKKCIFQIVFSSAECYHTWFTTNT